MNSAKKMKILLLICFVFGIVAGGCSKKEVRVLRAFDAKNKKLIVISGRNAVTKNFYEKADFVVLGGRLGGIAAALALCSTGREVILVEESDKITGCFAGDDTLSFAEGELIEKTGSSRSYKTFRSKINEWYKNKSLIPPSIAPEFSPALGNFRFRNFCFETEAAIDVINEMLEKNEKNGKLTILYRHKIAEVKTIKNRVASIFTIDLDNKVVDMVSGWFFIDASEQGDLLTMTGIETVSGMESKSETHEPHAPDKADSLSFQEFFICPDYEVDGKKKIVDQTAVFDVEKIAAPQKTDRYQFTVMKEPRRIVPVTRISEEDFSAENQKGPRAKFFNDSIGIGYTYLKVRMTDGQEAFIETKPFQIPFGALIPVKAENVLVANGNIGATYIAASALKTPEIEWAVGEAAGVAGTICGGEKISSQVLRSNPEKMHFLQHYLITKFGAPVFWYDDIGPDDPDFTKAQSKPFQDPAYYKAAENLHYRQSK